MKELTPSGWIGMLIGIVLFGSLVGHVAAQNFCSLKTASTDRLEYLDDLTKAFNISSWKTADCGASEVCLQYYPKALSTGRLKAYMQCGATCLTTGLAATEKMGGSLNDYECNQCISGTLSTCKDLTAVTRNAKKCYSYENQDKASVSEIKNVKQIFCLDSCQGVTRSDGKVFVGCATECETHKNGGTCAVCQNCEKLFAQSMCHTNTQNKYLETEAQITDAFNIASWTIKCAAKESCLQYIPRKPGNDKTQNGNGKVRVLVQCGTACEIKQGYSCVECHNLDSNNCKKIADVASAANECYVFGAAKLSGETQNVPKIFCFEKCQYKESGTTLTVNCASEVGAGGTDCPDSDLSCRNMIFKASVVPPGGNQATTTTLSTGTTTRPKTGNKLTISKYLLGSLAILLFATNQYMRQF